MKRTDTTTDGRTGGCSAQWPPVDDQPVTGPGPSPRPPARHRLVAQCGQATAEYALVMLAAAGLAGMALAWAVGGNGVERLMNAVMDSIIAEVNG